MAGLKIIAKAFGAITLGGVKHVYDYVSDVCVPESEMPFGSDRHKRSEKAKYLSGSVRTAFQCAARGCDGCSICKPNSGVYGE